MKGKDERKSKEKRMEAVRGGKGKEEPSGAAIDRRRWKRGTRRKEEEEEEEK